MAKYLRLDDRHRDVIRRLYEDLGLIVLVRADGTADRLSIEAYGFSEEFGEPYIAQCTASRVAWEDEHFNVLAYLKSLLPQAIEMALDDHRGRESA